MASIALAISTDYWLLLYEEVAYDKMSVDESVGVNTTIKPISVNSRIGLWRFCVLNEIVYGKYIFSCRYFIIHSVRFSFLFSGIFVFWK